MKPISRKHLFLFSLLAVFACTADLAGPWGAVETPSPGPARVIGTYTNGCLAGAEALPPEGTGYQSMRPSRHRFYGHPLLITYLQSFAREMASEKGFLLVGDMAQSRGGPLAASSHASHQTGLEADIWYSHPAEAQSGPLPVQMREELSATSLVLADGSAIDPTQWSAYDVTLLRTAASYPEVDRIFVHPAIKRALCQSDKGSAWLHKIRPWWGHNDHFHVRLKCPVSDASCAIAGDTIPAGDGCNATLDWWFTEEAKTPAPAAAKEKPPLPAACAALLAHP